jgi:hypothetical protein
MERRLKSRIENQRNRKQFKEIGGKLFGKNWRRELPKLTRAGISLMPGTDFKAAAKWKELLSPL